MNHPKALGAMREITHHVVPGDAAALRVFADEPDPLGGNASHVFVITGPDGETSLGEVVFQRGPVKEAGLNGVQGVALLSVLVERMVGFQAGPFACDQNAATLSALQSALHSDNTRTRERIARQVEGRNVA